MDYLAVLFRVGCALAVVLLLLVLFYRITNKLQPHNLRSKGVPLSIVSSIALSPKEKLVVVDTGVCLLYLGVSAGGVSLLERIAVKTPEPVEEQS